MFNLPRGRFTDALVACLVAVSIVQLAPAVQAMVFPYGFSPFLFLNGGWRDPLAWLGPIVSQFLLASVIATMINATFLLIAGRYAEKAVGGLGMLAIFIGGAYGGAIARTVLTASSQPITAGADAGLFALAGAGLMLYGVPLAIPINRNYSRPLQVALLAIIWAAAQMLFMWTGGTFELSRNILDPLGGLLTGALLAKPILLWRYRKA